MMGVGPIIVAPQLFITFAAILLSEKGLLPAVRTGVFRLPLLIAGILLILFGIWLWYSSNFKAKIDKYIESNKLATSGVYSIVRNPIYSAFFLACTGALLIENNVVLLALPFIFWAYMTAFLKRTEEKWLFDLYGQEYADYCARVNRCIPWCMKR